MLSREKKIRKGRHHVSCVELSRLRERGGGGPVQMVARGTKIEKGDSEAKSFVNAEIVHWVRDRAGVQLHLDLGSTKGSD